MKRICPSEEALAEYISGLLSPEERAPLDEHLSECRNCRALALEANAIIKSPDTGKIKRGIARWIRGNLWLVAAGMSLLLSFTFRRYFLQFLALTLIASFKWILDSRNTRLLITIHEAWKRGDKEKAGHVLSEFDPEE